jgi:hypothetical protein
MHRNPDYETYHDIDLKLVNLYLSRERDQIVLIQVRKHGEHPVFSVSTATSQAILSEHVQSRNYDAMLAND